MPFNQGIFPTSVYGQLSDSYGLPTYTATVGFPGPPGTGLVQGQGWLLFDFTMVNLLKAAASIAANAACMVQSGSSNFYTVINAVTSGSNAVGTAPVTAINDRGGALTTIGGYNWMTTYGLGTVLVAASQTSTFASTGVPVGASSTAGVLTSVGAAGTAYYNNVLLINTTTTAGAYPVILQ
jgi:hypothetical protein